MEVVVFSPNTGGEVVVVVCWAAAEVTMLAATKIIAVARTEMVAVVAMKWFLLFLLFVYSIYHFPLRIPG